MPQFWTPKATRLFTAWTSNLSTYSLENSSTFPRKVPCKTKRAWNLNCQTRQQGVASVFRSSLAISIDRKVIKWSTATRSCFTMLKVMLMCTSATLKKPSQHGRMICPPLSDRNRLTDAAILRIYFPGMNQTLALTTKSGPSFLTVSVKSLILKTSVCMVET
jgi:hypothetical protein